MNHASPRSHGGKIIELMWNGEGRIKIRYSKILPGEWEALDEYNHKFNQPGLKAPPSDKRNPGPSQRRDDFGVIKKARRFGKQYSSRQR